MPVKGEDVTTHLANCPVLLNTPGACLGCADIMGATEPGRKRKKPTKSAYERAQNANYMRDRRQRPKRIAGEDFRYDSVDHLPPIEIDANGFAKKPPTPPEAWKYSFTLEQRKVRFLLMWNYGGGNWTLAAQFAGVPEDLAREWFKTDARLPPLLERARREIADRVRLRLFQVAGLVAIPKQIAVNTTALLGIVKDYGIQIPSELPMPDAAATPVATLGSPSQGVGEALGGIPRPKVDAAAGL